MQFKLRSYQNDAVTSTINHFRKTKAPAVIVLPTGSGKSLVIAELSRLAKGRVLVVTHVKELVQQNFEKFESHGIPCGIYSAGLGQKDLSAKTTFASIQSLANAPADQLTDVSLVIVDECHRVSGEATTQYQEALQKIESGSERLCVVGLTATPYRSDSGWIYNFHADGHTGAEEPRFFKTCVYEQPLSNMIKEGYLSRPVFGSTRTLAYDFSSLFHHHEQRSWTNDELEDLIADQSNLTPGIVGHIVKQSEDRHGVMIFASSIRHAKQVMKYLPEDSALITGDTTTQVRDQIIQQFKAREIKFLVNVSVLTTGFDAPHVDLIAILRPTESLALYQQIIGRGLRLSDGKDNCLILDYAGNTFDIFEPKIDVQKPNSECVRVTVPCPQCGFDNLFWGLVDDSGTIFEHFGRKCKGADPVSQEACGYRFRYKLCPDCGSENDIAARACWSCAIPLVDPEKRLQQLRKAKDTHLMQPDRMEFRAAIDGKGRNRLQVEYFDLDGQSLREFFYFDSPGQRSAFYFHFARIHTRCPGLKGEKFKSAEEVTNRAIEFRIPEYLVAQKNGKFWNIAEKVFR